MSGQNAGKRDHILMGQPFHLTVCLNKMKFDRWNLKKSSFSRSYKFNKQKCKIRGVCSDDSNFQFESFAENL